MKLDSLRSLNKFVWQNLRFWASLKISELTNFVNSLIIYGSPNGNRTRDSALRGRCLNLLTMGPYHNSMTWRYSMSYILINILQYYSQCAVTPKSHTRTFAGGFPSNHFCLLRLKWKLDIYDYYWKSLNISVGWTYKFCEHLRTCYLYYYIIFNLSFKLKLCHFLWL